MSSFGKMFGGTMGILIAIGIACAIGIGGCLLICGGAASLPMLSPAVKQAREAAKRSREKKAIEDEQRAEADVEVKPEETPETE